MALKIRLSRGGAKKRPYYRIVVADGASPRDGRFLERLGSYNPMLAKDDPARLQLNAERVKYWLGHGAQPTERMAKFLGQAEILPTPATPNRPKKSQPKAKAQERLKMAAAAEEEKAAKAAADAEAAKAEAEAAKAAAEAPAVEEPKAEAEPAPAAEAASAEETPAAEAPEAAAPAEEPKAE